MILFVKAFFKRIAILNHLHSYRKSLKCKIRFKSFLLRGVSYD